MELPESTKNNVRQLIDQNKKLDAVKLVKEEFNLALRDALNLVEAIEANEVVRFNTFQRDPYPRRSFGVRSRPFSLVYKVMLGIGVFLCAIAGGLAYDTVRILEESERVPATVIGFVQGSGFIPIVQYTYNGILQEAEGKVSSQPPAYDIGEETAVYVPKDGSQTVHIDSISELWLAPIILSCIGFVFLLIGGIFAFTQRT